MNTTRLIQARRLFMVPGVAPTTARHNARQWARSVRFLGARWHLAQQQPKAPSQVTLGQLRERLEECRRGGYYERVIDLVTGETLGERLELVLAEREIEAGLRPPVWGSA